MLNVPQKRIKSFTEYDTKEKIVPFNIAWYEALKDSAGPEVRLAVYEAVFEWIKSGERPDINKMTDVVGMALRFIMLDMDKES